VTAERFANLAETTLASSYTSGGTTLSVTSAALFPSAGVFAVGLGNTSRTVWRVDSLSGTTFTGAAEEFDANASAGATVTLIGSKRVAERWLQAPESTIGAVSGTAAADTFGPVWKLTPIVAADWAWRNQGSATVNDANGISFLSCPAQTQNMRARMKNIAVKTYTAIFVPWLTAVASGEVGIGFLESTTNKWQVLRVANDGGIYVSNWTADATVAGNQATGPAVLGYARVNHFRVQYDNTNLIFSYSFDGWNFRQLLSNAKNAQFTTAPDKVVYFINERTNANPCSMSVYSWTEV